MATGSPSIEARLKALEHDRDEDRRQIRELQEMVAKAKGAWWALVKIGGLFTLISAALAWGWDKLHG